MKIDSKTSDKPSDITKDFGIDDDNQNAELSKWIQATFKMTVSGSRKNESDPSLNVESKLTDKDRKTDTEEEVNTTLVGTNAFGEVEFVDSGQKISKYICVDHQANVDDLMTLMLKHWSMEKPKLVISVTGGAQNFTIKRRLKEAFCQGLVKAAKSTRAWVITAGTNTGVTKLVGEALRDYAIKRGTQKQLVALGIATWGCIKNRDDLISKKDESGGARGCTCPAKYRISKPSEKESVLQVPLDPNHTHFILVDDGSQGIFRVAIALRTRLENRISKMATKETDKFTMNKKSGVIPLVCVALEGGLHALETIKEAIVAKIPAVVIAGSGRAADILANAYHKRHSFVETASETKEKHDESIRREVERECIEQFKTYDKVRIDKCVQTVMFCTDEIDYLTFFRLDDEHSARDIDVAILKAILKVNCVEKYYQTRLALAWDRVDVAEEEIFTEGYNLKEDELTELMLRALLNDRVEFVKLFLEKGLSLKEFLTEKRLLQLYNSDLKKGRCQQLQQIAKKNGQITLEGIGSWIKALSGKLFEPKGYSDQVKGDSDVSPTDKPQTLLKEFSRDMFISDEHACRDLFLWSVLTQRQEMAMVFWHKGKEELCMAVLGHLLLSNLYANDPDPESNDDLQRQVNFYKDLAIDFLSKCHSSGQRKSIQLLRREMTDFGNTTVLKMAVHADNKKFVAHPTCQDLITKVWNGELRNENHFIQFLLAVFLFFLSPFLLKFRKREGIQKELNTSEDKCSCLLSPRERVSDYFLKLWDFFQAPVIKFFYNCFSYLVFLILFGIILLTDFHPTIGLKEYILIIWVGTLIVEEIRQIKEEEAGDIGWKFHNYITDVWNVIDVITIVTFLTGMILRFIPVAVCGQCFYSARIILALNLLSFFARILHLFSIHKELGPKLAMIGRMVIDMIFFLIILFVFIAAYGIASHAILYPNQPLNIELAHDVLSRPLWNIFGENGLEEISGADCKSETIRSHDPEQCASLEYEDFALSDCIGYKAEKCPSIQWLVPIILSIYVLITNVLMLNLLIAMFSYTFTNIQEHSNEVWKMQRYHLVKEYESRPWLHPPLIAFVHAYRLIRYCIRKFRDENKENGNCQKCSNVFDIVSGNFCEQRHYKFKFTPSASEEKELLDWENVNAQEFKLERESKDVYTEDGETKDINDKLDLILRRVEKLDETTERRLDELEKRKN